MLLCVLDDANKYRTVEDITNEYLQRLMWHTLGDVNVVSDISGVGKEKIQELINSNKITYNEPQEKSSDR